MQTIAIVLTIGSEHAEAFERGFREMELPIWRDLHARGLLVTATLSRLDISTQPDWNEPSAFPERPTLLPIR